MDDELRQLCRVLRSTVSPLLAKGRERFAVELKEDGSLVTDLDREIQDRVTDELSLLWSKVPLLGEEMTPHEQEAIAQSERYFVLDPLDGTTNFVHGVPFYAVSIALVEQGQTRLAVTFDPNRDECFSAHRGEGAWLNQQVLRLYEQESGLERALAVVDVKRLPPYLAAALVSRHPFQSMRNFGSVALEWAWLAAGRIDIYLHGGQKLWDRLPGQLIHREAGGVQSTLLEQTPSAGAADVLDSRGRIASNSEALMAQLGELSYLAPYIDEKPIHE